MSEFYLTGTIDRLEENRAVIRTDDGQQIIWPIAKMPDGTSEGDVVKIAINNDQSETLAKEKIAKAVLNELLKVDKNV